MSEFDILEEIVELEAEMANSNGVVAFGHHNNSSSGRSSSASLSNIGALHSLEEAILCTGTRASQQQQQQQSEGTFGEDDESAASTVDVNDFQCPISQCTFFSKVDGELLSHFRATHIKCPNVQVFDPAESVNRLLYRCPRAAAHCL